MRAEDIMEKNVVFCSEDMPLREVASLMVKNRIHQVALPDGRMISSMDIANADPEEKASRKARKYGILAPDSGEDEMLGKILSSGSKALPVMENGKVVGIVGLADIVRELSVDPVEFAHGPVITIGPDESSAKAREIMKDMNISRIAVTRDEKMVGVVSDIDLLKIVAEEYRGKMPAVSVIMESFQPIDNPTSEEIMEELFKYGVFYFTRDGIPYGVVTLVDIASSYYVSPPAVEVKLIGIDDSFAKDKLSRLGSKLSKIVTVNGIVAHAKPAGDSYEIKVRAYTNIGNFVYSTSSADILTGIDEAVDSIEERVKSKKEKIRDLRRKIYFEF